MLSLRRPAMLGMIDSLKGLFEHHGINVTRPRWCKCCLSLKELVKLVYEYDG